MSKINASNDNAACRNDDGGQDASQANTKREKGIARGKAHNQELHELAQIRKHGGYQRALPM